MLLTIDLLFILSFFSAFTSQSFLDICDFLVVVTALTLAYKNGEFGVLLKKIKDWKYLWVAWILALIISVSINSLWSNSSVVRYVLEYRWIFSLASLAYLFTKIESEKFIIKYLAPLYIFLNAIAIFIHLYIDSDRAGGIYDQVMSFSHNIAPSCVFFILYLATNWKGSSVKNRIIFFVASATSLYLTYATLTRGVWIGTAFAILVALFIYKRKLFFVSLAFASLAFASVFYLNPEVKNRFSFAKESETSSSGYIRMALLRANIEIVKDNPLWGVGPEQNKTFLADYFKKLGYFEGLFKSHAHNQYLEIWANTGLFSFLCFIIFYIAVLRSGLQTYFSETSKKEKKLSLALTASALCFMVGSITECNFNISKNRFFFLIIAAWILSLALNKEASKKANLTPNT